MMIKDLTKTLNNLKSHNGKKSLRNNASTFLPIETKTQAIHMVDWACVYKRIYQMLLGLECTAQTTEELFSNIIDDLKSDRNTKELANLVEKTYFKDNEFCEFSPFAKLVHKSEPDNLATKSMVAIYEAMLLGFEAPDLDHIGNNFVEELIFKSIKKQCIRYNLPTSKNVYLPFLATILKKDFLFSLKNPVFLNDNFEAIIELHSFLYLMQLALNLHLSDVRFKKPVSQEIYFILEGEKASKERHSCYIKGYRRLLDKDVGACTDLFPHLGYLALVTEEPIWLLSEKKPDDISITKVNELNKMLCEVFDISFLGFRSSFEQAISDGLNYHKNLFKSTSKKSTRSGVNNKILGVISDVFAKNFKVNKGRAGGWYFQLSTKTVLLLTNLIIGDKKKLLIDDVVEGFNERGIYFDLKSKQALLAIYENIGNVIKLSDSGDAVYVTSTI